MELIMTFEEKLLLDTYAFYYLVSYPKIFKFHAKYFCNNGCA